MKRSRRLPLFIYIDLSRRQGLGHFRRTQFFLDQLLAKVRADCTFLIRPNREYRSLKRLIGTSARLPVLPFEPEKRSFWSRLENPSLFVCDSYSLEPKELEEWKGKIQTRWIAFDDLSRDFRSADLVISPNATSGGGLSPTGREKLKGGPVFLEGEKYFVLDRRYVRANQKKRLLRRELRNLLISVGGNPGGETLTKILRAFSSAKRKMRIKIFLGPFANALASRNGRWKAGNEFQFIRGFSDMLEGLLWADGAVISGGITKYEAAATGTPSVIVAQHPAQIPFVKPFEEKGAAVGVGVADSLSRARLEEAFNQMEDYHFRTRLSARAKAFIDGRGFERLWPVLEGFLK